MVIQNGIPLAAVILESFVGLFMLFLAIRSAIRFRDKHSKVTLYLMFGLFSYAVAAIISGITKYVDYNSSVSRDVVSYSTAGILIAYCLMTMANIFFSLLLTELFLEEDNQFPLFISIGSFIVIGLIIPNIEPVDGAYESIVLYLIIFIIITAILHGRLARRALRESGSTTSKLTKVGFQLIALFSILVITTLVLFIVDLVYGTIRGSGYTLFYYLGWSTVGLSTIAGFLGYIMPNWFRQMVQPTSL